VSSCFSVVGCACLVLADVCAFACGALFVCISRLLVSVLCRRFAVFEYGFYQLFRSNMIFFEFVLKKKGIYILFL
jgi:hypothetical protein